MFNYVIDALTGSLVAALPRTPSMAASTAQGVDELGATQTLSIDADGTTLVLRDTTLNIPMSAGSGDEEYLHAFDHAVEPAVARFEPELVLVSAGFDAHRDDPLADMRVTADGFRELSRRCAALAPRVAAVLEGGYELETLPGLVDAALDGFNS